MISVVSIPRFADEVVICPMGNSRRLRKRFGDLGWVPYKQIQALNGLISGKVGKIPDFTPKCRKNPQNPPGFPPASNDSSP